MPLLFAVTLFVSASLLFMVQPMVGKMILPLLGGSPAVWNACMVFFQVLLLLGYLYAHWMSTRHDPKAQGWLHSLVLLTAIAAFALAVLLGAKHTPIAIAEGLAPTDGGNPFFAVLALLLVAIGVPFFVASTSAPLLQRWFSFTGHPSSRDPYFLYAASNVGSLVSLLGYPLFIEPYMTIKAQAWFFAGGFAVLAVLIMVCGRAAANPVGVPPGGGGSGGGKLANGPVKSSKPGALDVIAEPPPSPLRIAKWVLLAFVPSSFMLAVTFHMSTDIASIPLLWVFPLALYLVTFIISFSTLVPPWFRTVLGNLTPIMLLLLVFVTCAPHVVPVAPTLAIHITVFFFAALMCHYELARDRPKDVTHLTQYFVWMSVGGMLGGMFNGIVAPLVFTQALEYPITIVIACGMVPVFVTQAPKLADRLFPNLAGPVGQVAEWLATAGITLAVFLVSMGFCYVVIGALFDFTYWYVFALVPVWAVMWQWRNLRSREYVETNNPEELPLAKLSKTAKKTDFRVALDIAVPLTMGVVVWLLTVWEAGQYTSRDSSYASLVKRISGTITMLTEVRVGALLIWGIPAMACFFFVDRPVRFALCVAAILGIYYYKQAQDDSIVHTERSFFGILKVESRGYFTRLVHGTTLHGTQINEYYIVRADAPIVFGVFSPWDVLALEGALNRWDPRQEPLTYYHRTGPVGAMFWQTRMRAIEEGRDPAKDRVAMVGLGTGSAACYALRGQELDFYEIDPAVVRIVEKPWKVMNQKEIDEAKAAGTPVPEKLMGPITYVQGARDRGGLIDFKMGDARLKLRDYTGQKYSLLLVDAFSSDAIPVHLLTKEAVEMYMTKITEHGLLALHISNKYVRLEPVVAGIAEALNLKARVWNDDSESRPGKTASSWCVLARTEADLGVLGKSAVEQAKGFGTRNEPLVYLLNKYGPEKNAKEAIEAEWGGPESERGKLTPTLMSIREGPQAAILYQYAIRMRDKGLTGKDANLEAMTAAVFGQMFHDVRVLKDVELWTDDYSDVLRVIMIKEVQRVRKAFGLPTPVME